MESKKVKFIVLFIFTLIIMFSIKVYGASEEFELARTNNNFFRQGSDYIQILSMPQYIFGVSASNIYRYDLESDTGNEKIYEGYSRFYGKYIGYYVYNDIIYIATDTTNGETNVTGFNVVKNEVVYEQNFPVQLESYTKDQFVIGNDGYAYFRNKEKSLQIYDKEGNLTDEYADISKDIYPVRISENNNILIFLRGYIAVKDGKFVNYDYKVISDVGDSNQIYSRDGTYSLGKYGVITKYNFETNKLVGDFYFTSLKGYNKSGYPTGYFDNNGKVYLEGENNHILIYNLEEKKVEHTLTINDDKFNAIFVTVYDNKIHVYGYSNKERIGQCTYEYDLSELGKATAKIVKNHVAYSHSKQDIINKYNETRNSFNEDSVYEVEPSLSAPYSEGQLKDSYIQNALKGVNYYRWLAGLKDLTLDSEEWMQKEQKGAVLSAVNNQLSHYQSCPEDMEYEFWDAGNRACQSSIINQGSSLYGSISSFINDHRNPMGNVGHRYELLNIEGDKISMGFCRNKSSFATMHISENDERKKDNSEIFYSWPVPGYQEATNWAKDAKWSIFLQSDFVINEDEVKVTLTVDGKTYNPKLYVSVFNFMFFVLPDEAKNYLTDNSTSMVSGRKANVKLEGIYDRSYNEYIIDYDTEFFYVEESPIEKIQVYKLNSVNASFLTGVNEGSTIKLDKNNPETYILFRTNTTSATDVRLEIENENSNILQIENVTDQSSYKSSGYLYKLTGLKNGKTNVTAKRKIDGKQLLKLPVEISVSTLGDVNNDGNITVADCAKILAYIKGTINLTTDEKQRADVTGEGNVTLADCARILAYIKGNATLD